MLMSWESYCFIIFNNELKKYGSYRKTAKALGVSTRTIYNAIQMISVPSVARMKQIFPALDIPEIMVDFKR